MTHSRSLRRRGYTHLNFGKCSYCGEEIEWYQSPTGKKVPMDERGRPHWLKCAKLPNLSEKLTRPARLVKRNREAK